MKGLSNMNDFEKKLTLEDILLENTNKNATAPKNRDSSIEQWLDEVLADSTTEKPNLDESEVLKKFIENAYENNNDDNETKNNNDTLQNIIVHNQEKLEIEINDIKIEQTQENSEQQIQEKVETEQKVETHTHFGGIKADFLKTRREKAANFVFNPNENGEINLTKNQELEVLVEENNTNKSQEVATVEENASELQKEKNDEKQINEENITFIKHQLKSLKSSLSVRFFCLAISLIFALYVLIGNQIDFILPFLNKQTNPFGYIVFNAILLVLGFVCSFSTIKNGLWSFFTLRSDRDTPVALCFLATLIQNGIMFIDPTVASENNMHLFSTFTIFGLLFNTIGKLKIVNRAILNYRFVSSKYDKYAMNLIEDDNVSKDLTKGVVAYEATVITNKQTEEIENFLEHSYTEDSSDALCRIASPVSFAFAIIGMLATFIITGNWYTALAAFTGIICVSSPISMLFAVNQPLSKASKSLSKVGGAILGASELEDYAHTNACLINAIDLFPDNTIGLQGIKTFSGARIDEALLDAASVVYSAKSIFTDMFMQIISNKKEMLKPVDSIVYEESLGISAWVDNKRVIIGSRELMQHHEIEVPSKEYEQNHFSEANELIYLSTSGTLTAVFLIKINPKQNIQELLNRLEENNIKVIVKTVDSIVTNKRLEDNFDVDSDLFKILMSSYHQTFNKQTEPIQKTESSIINNGSFVSYVSTILAAKRLRISIIIGIVLQIAAIVMGISFCALFISTNGLGQLSNNFLLLYNLIWFIITIIALKTRSLK